MNGNVEDIEGLYVSEVWDFLFRDDDDDMYINPLYVEKREMKRKRLMISTRVASLSVWKRAYCGCLPNIPESRELDLEMELRKYRRLLVSNCIALQEEEKEEEKEEENAMSLQSSPPPLPPRGAKTPSTASKMTSKVARTLLGSGQNTTCPELPPRNAAPLTPTSPRTKLKTKKNLVIISKLKIGDKIAFNKKSGLLKLHTPSLGTKMTRTFTRESRWTGLNKVQQTLNDALSLVEEGEETDRSEIEVIKSVLTEALGTGLENLKSTYESDESVAAYVSKIQRISLARLSRAHDLRWGEMRNKGELRNSITI